MAQVTYLDNFYPIIDLANWPGLVSKLEWAQGKQIADHATEITFDVVGKPDHATGLWTLTMGDKDGTKGVYAELDGVMKINDPMFVRLRTAEDLVRMLLQLRQFNNPGQGVQDVDSADLLAEYSAVTNDPLAGYNNFYQIQDPMTWLETAGRLAPWGDIETLPMIQVKTSNDHLTDGVYTLRKKATEDGIGIEVELDGAPLPNYPKPTIRTAEQVVEVILKLHAMFSTAQPVRRADHEQAPWVDVPPVLVASVKTGQSEVKMFANGLITIANRGLLSITAEKAEEIVNGLGEIVDAAVGDV